MAKFPSKEWLEELVRLANADPESKIAGKGWRGDFGAVVEAEPPALQRAFAMHCVPADGQITRVRVLRDPDELEEIEPAYLARAPYSVWKGLIKKTIDPVEAVLKRRLVFTGDLQPLMERLSYRSILDRVLTQLKTDFADD